MVNYGREGQIYVYFNVSTNRNEVYKTIEKSQHSLCHIEVLKYKHEILCAINGIIKHKYYVILQNEIRIYMDYYETDLLDLINERKKYFDLNEIIIIKNKLIEIIISLHHHNIVHRDIKPENILVNQKIINNQTEIVLCDLEAIALCDTGYYSKMSYGTCEYIHPSATYDSIDKKHDIYSLLKTVTKMVSKDVKYTSIFYQMIEKERFFEILSVKWFEGE